MPVIHDTIPQFFNGVSQQAPNLRRTSQLDAQENCFSSIADGVLPRPPSEAVAQVSETSIGNAHIHTINRSSVERFIVLVKNGGINVYDMNGVQQTVTYPAGLTYLTSSDPKNDFEAYTVKDFTFIVNKTITTGNLTKSAGSLTATVQKFSNLGDKHADDGNGGFYKIEGEADTGFDSYYVQKTVNNVDKEGDVYEEVADPRLTSIALNPVTMPHQLVRTGTNTFEFQQIEWVDRAAGDDTTNPMPSFVGQTISDLFVYRNRFGFLSGDNVILSESGAENFFNFFRTTVTQVLDSDPIDVSANNTRVADLRFAVPFVDSLLLFSEQTQFEMGSDDLLTPATVEIKPTTAFVTSTKARPVQAGRNIYFTVERTEYSGLREYFVESDNIGNDAADVTKHVPRYIPKDVYKIIPSSNDDMLFLLTEQDPSKIYVYQWYWAQTQGGLNKLQSAMHRWDMGEGSSILNIDLIDNELFILIERDNKTYLELIDLTTRKFDMGLNFQVRLDRRVSVTGVYDTETNKTTWTLPYSTSVDSQIVRGGGFSKSAGLQVLNTTQASATSVEAVGDHSESECIIGVPYTKTFTLSPIFIRKPTSGGSSVARLGGRLMLRKFLISYSGSAFFTVMVTPKARETTTRNFSPAIGTNESVIGSVVPQDGVFSVPIMSKADTTNITIESNSYLPFAITSAEWEGFYHSNAR